MSSFELEMNYYISVEGSQEFVEELRDKIDDLVYEALKINCGDPECCPEPRGANFVPSAMGSSTINPITQEENE